GSTWAWLTWRGAPGRGSSYSPSRRACRNRERHLPTMPSEARTFRATVLLSHPWPHASTTRARRASSGWLRARWDSDWSRSCSSSVKINACLGRPVRIKASYILDATPHDLVHLFLGQETSS